MSRLVACASVSAALLLAPATAGAAGPPLPSSLSDRAGVSAPGANERLFARRAGDDTTVTAVSRGDRRVLRSRRIRGRWSVPPVTLDNGTTGLSADGRTLVLARRTRDFPPASTRLAVLDARRLRVRREIALRGFFTVDAISPDGRWVYLLQYAGDNVLDYRVRPLDARTGRLAARDVVDPREPDEQMGGLPFTRLMSADGRWAYTLYGGGEETFIHALDTVGRTAACIDLERLPPNSDLSRVRLGLSEDGRRLRVRDNGRLLATVDTRTFAVSDPGEEAAAKQEELRAVVTPPADGGSFPWAALLLVVPAGALAALRRRRARAC